MSGNMLDDMIRKIYRQEDGNFVKFCGVIGAITSNILTAVACYSGYEYFFPNRASGEASSPATHTTFNNTTKHYCCSNKKCCSKSDSDEVLLTFALIPTFLGYAVGTYIGIKLEDGAGYCYNLLGDHHN